MTLGWSTIEAFPGNRADPALVAARPCPVCGHEETRPVASYEGFQFYSDSAARPKRTDVRTVACRRCFALFMNPCYTAAGFATLFAEAGMSYGSHGPARHDEQAAWLSARGLLAPGAAVLDAGCYDGAFLAGLPAVDRIGVDIDAPAIARGRERHPDVAFVLGDFERFRPPRPPTAITLFHVLEHLPRPVAVLQHLRAIAAPDARLVVEVPILENGHTNDINGFFSVQHLTHFSRATLRAALARGGWRVVEQHEQPDYNGCRVLAAPCDPHELAPDPRDTERTHALVAAHSAALAAAAARVMAVPPDDRVVLWGGGAHTEVLHHVTPFFDACPERPLAIVDGDPLKHGTTWRGVSIHPPAALEGAGWSEAWLLISSYGAQPAMARAAVSLGVPESRIVRIYDEVRTY